MRVCGMPHSVGKGTGRLRKRVSRPYRLIDKLMAEVIQAAVSSPSEIAGDEVNGVIPAKHNSAFPPVPAHNQECELEWLLCLTHAFQTAKRRPFELADPHPKRAQGDLGVRPIHCSPHARRKVS